MPFTARSREQAKRLRTLDGRLSLERIAELARLPKLLQGPAHLRQMSFLTCRIRGFTEIAQSSGLDPEPLSAMTRRIMTPLAHAVLERDGMIAHLTPGMIAAIFNAPLDDKRHAFHACECALATLQALEKVNHALELHMRVSGTEFGPLGLGIGIDTGEAAFGDFGTDAFPHYAAAGAVVEEADGLEQLSAHYGTAILAGSAIAEATEKSFAFLEVDSVADNDDSKIIYALLGSPLSRANPKFLALKAFHEHIFAAIGAHEWDNARTLIDQARALSGANPALYDLYVKRIAQAQTRPISTNAPRAVEPTFS